MGLKTCRLCGIPQDISEYYLDTYRARPQRKTACRKCLLEVKRKKEKLGPIDTRFLPREPTKICPLCYSLSHRVVGRSCKRCGRPHAEEQMPEQRLWGSCCLADAV